MPCICIHRVMKSKEAIIWKRRVLRAIEFLKKKKFEIGTLVTDRHKQISEWAIETIPSTDHRYDIWHIAKCKL